jgi:hypothetical protein
MGLVLLTSVVVAGEGALQARQGPEHQAVEVTALRKKGVIPVEFYVTNVLISV